MPISCYLPGRWKWMATKVFMFFVVWWCKCFLFLFFFTFPDGTWYSTVCIWGQEHPCCHSPWRPGLLLICASVQLWEIWQCSVSITRRTQDHSQASQLIVIDMSICVDEAHHHDSYLCCVCVLNVLGINVFWLQCPRCGTVGKCRMLMLDLSYIAWIEWMDMNQNSRVKLFWKNSHWKRWSRWRL